MEEKIIKYKCPNCGSEHVSTETYIEPYFDYRIQKYTEREALFTCGNCGDRYRQSEMIEIEVKYDALDEARAEFEKALASLTNEEREIFYRHTTREQMLIVINIVKSVESHVDKLRSAVVGTDTEGE